MLQVECPFVALGGAAGQQRLLATLPQAHTCTNTLELPNYWTALSATQPCMAHEQRWQQCRQVLEERLTTAIQGCVGYGLDE
jgi:hypothetical protein